MTSKKAIESLLTEEDSLEKSLKQVGIKINKAVAPLVLKHLKFYKAQGGSWPGMDTRNITQGINEIEGYKLENHTIRGVCIYLREKGELKSERNSCYELNPMKHMLKF